MTLEQLAQGDPWTAEEILQGRGWPRALAKATVDPYIYAIGLRDGTVILFEAAASSQDHLWAHLTEPRVAHPTADQANSPSSFGPGDLPEKFGRGIDVRVSEIVWAADNPWGH